MRIARVHAHPAPPPAPPLSSEQVARACLSLEGLSLGDAFGERFFFVTESAELSPEAPLPPAPWSWTDDTHMALSVVEVLQQYGTINPDELARAFARRFDLEPNRGYTGAAYRLLSELAMGGDWRVLATAMFDGHGSHGNGAAMRAAPIGAAFAGDPERAAREAQCSAAVTHAHPEGQAGAIAVAVAASLAACAEPLRGRDLVDSVLSHLPASEVRTRLIGALAIDPDDLARACDELGTGYELSAQDTVPFCIWSAAHHGHDYERALWCTVAGLGDRDTTCAIVGGIVALSAPTLPAAWLERREPLPAAFRRT